MGKICRRFRAYKDGLFVWKSALWEDIKEYTGSEGNGILVYSSAIYTITEIVLFLKRFYEEIAIDTDIYVKIILNNTKNRQLSELDPWVNIRENCKSQESRIKIVENNKVADLKIEYLGIANSIARKLLSIFNLDEVTEEIIEQWQKKLLGRVSS